MNYDIIIIGTGAGGGTMAQALSQTSARILILERGDFVPQESENWDPDAVWKQLETVSGHIKTFESNVGLLDKIFTSVEAQARTLMGALHQGGGSVAY